MWHRIAAFIIKFRIVLLIVLALATAVMGYFATKVELSYEFTTAIPTDNPKYQDYQAFRKQFGEDGNMMVIGVQTDKFFTPEFFNDYVATVKKLERVKAVDNVLSIPGAINLVKDTASGKLQTVKIAEAAPYADITPIKNTIYSLPFYNGLLYNAATSSYLMAVRIDKQVLNSKHRKDVVNELVAISDSFGKRHNVEMRYSGLPLIRTMMANKVQSEMRLFLIMSFVLTAVILILFFRSAVAVFSSMLVVAFGVIWSMGTIALLGYKITLLTALIPPLIVVIGIPNCVYLLNKYHAEYNRRANKIRALVLTVSKMGIVTLFTNLTAAIGFGVFFFTKSALLKEFGLVAGINIMAVFFISLIFIPALFSFLPPPSSKHTNYLQSKWMHSLLNSFTKWVFGHRVWIYGLTIVACVASAIGMARLNTVGYIVDDLPKEDRIYRDLKFFEANFGGVMPLEIVIDTKKKNGAVSLPMLQKMDELIVFLKGFPEIGHALAITEGVKFARQAYYGGDSSNYGIPNLFDAAFIQPYLRAKPGTGGKNSLASLTNSFVDSNKQKTRISINMADVGSVRLPQMLDSIRPKTYEIFDTASYDVSFTGTGVVFLEGSKFIINSLRESLILAFIMIFGCMVALFRSWRILLISVVVNIVPLLITAGLMGWVGIPIKPSTVLVFSVALGITIDVTIRFLVNFKQELSEGDDIAKTVQKTIHDTGISIIYTSLILIAGFGVFALSEFDGTKSLGYLTSLTLFLAMVTNLTLQPALLLWMAKAVNKNKGAQ